MLSGDTAVWRKKTLERLSHFPPVYTKHSDGLGVCAKVGTKVYLDHSTAQVRGAGMEEGNKSTTDNKY